MQNGTIKRIRLDLSQTKKMNFNILENLFVNKETMETFILDPISTSVFFLSFILFVVI